MNKRRYFFYYIKEESSDMPSETIFMNGHQLGDDGCYTLKMSGDDFGITNYNETVFKTISVFN